MQTPNVRVKRIDLDVNWIQNVRWICRCEKLALYKVWKTFFNQFFNMTLASIDNSNNYPRPTTIISTFTWKSKRRPSKVDSKVHYETSCFFFKLILYLPFQFKSTWVNARAFSCWKKNPRQMKMMRYIFESTSDGRWSLFIDRQCARVTAYQNKNKVKRGSGLGGLLR